MGGGGGRVVERMRERRRETFGGNMDEFGFGSRIIMGIDERIKYEL